jgi:large conductance mechanosensitive channel protein
MKMKSSKFIERFGSEFREFRAFALRANAVDLAIAVILGAAFTAVVQDLFTPVIAAFFGQTNFANLFSPSTGASSTTDSS